MTVQARKRKSGITIPEKEKQRTTTQINNKETHMNYIQFRSMMKNNKFHAQKAEYNGRTYDSKKEARRASVLEQQVRCGIITGLRKQVEFTLQPAYVNNQGKKIREIKYIADFVYNKDGKLYVEDTKGFRTPEYKIKRKIFEYQYPGYTFVES